jgi:hypothetical protein
MGTSINVSPYLSHSTTYQYLVAPSTMSKSWRLPRRGQEPNSKRQTSAGDDPSDHAAIPSPEILEIESQPITENENEVINLAYPRLPRLSALPPITEDVQIYANFVKMDTSGAKDIRMYRIVLGKVNGKVIKKTEVKKALIRKLLHVQHVPKSGFWISDYVSHIISIGPLYADPEPVASFGYKLHRL